MTFSDHSAELSGSSEQGGQLMGLFWMLRLDKPLPPVVAPGIAATFARAGSEDSADLAAAMGLDDTEPVLQRFARGCQASVARVEGRLVSYGWITFDREDIGSLGLSVRLLPGEAYIWDCATLLSYRGQHLYPALLSHMVRELHAAAFRRIWIGMDADNGSSRAGVARAGFQQIVSLWRPDPAAPRTFLLRGSPGVPAQDIQDAQYALLGARDQESITLPD
jgi:ribosomal protein S18 acetylase RimI-like enzyme